MRAWTGIWLLPVGLLVVVVLISLGDVTGYLLATLWGLVLFPYGAVFMRRHSRDRRDGSGFSEDDTDYWRITLR
jgi:hypothetical protein